MNFFKLRLIFLANFFLITLSACTEPDYYLYDGRQGSLQDFQGKWLVINYWADWCPPCIKEMPELSEFYELHRDEALVLAYNFDSLEGEELEEQLIRFKVNIPSLLTDPKALFGIESPESLPATYFISPNGHLKRPLIGPQTKETLELFLEEFKKS